MSKREITFRGRTPAVLAFGTSGLRGLVSDLTDLEVCVSTAGFIDYLRAEGLVPVDGTVLIGGDLRPSTTRILHAVAHAVVAHGLRVAYAGRVPTPALTLEAMQRGLASIMVTGSHIPFDRNGIKFNRPDGEVLKHEEAPILAAIDRVRAREYAREASASAFDDDGMLRAASPTSLPAEDPACGRRYVERFTEFFPPGCLAGLRLGFYEHSAVGRELIPEILERLGAEVFRIGRSDTFVALDTEAIDAASLAHVGALAAEVRQRHGRIHAMVSTDGDSDRPLLLAVRDDGSVGFHGGDRLGIVVADRLGADVVCVPVSASDAIEQWFAPRSVQVRRTRIGSPWVIAAMRRQDGRCVVGWEANGGFLLGSSLARGDARLDPLPTRDATLPIVCVLAAAAERGGSLDAVFSALPDRHTRAGLLDAVAPDVSRGLLARLSPGDERIVSVRFAGSDVLASDAEGVSVPAAGDVLDRLDAIRSTLSDLFGKAGGFTSIVAIDYTDGVRLFFENGDIAHVRPSGNAPQLRIYAVAGDVARAEAIVALAVREPDGLLRRLCGQGGLSTAPG